MSDVDDVLTIEQQNEVRVFLIDDQEIVAEGLRRMLAGEEQIQYGFCLSARQALPQVKRFRPTVILQDLVMPDMEGLLLLGLLKNDPVTRDIPIIVLSSQDDPKLKSDAFAVGASDYLVKFPDRLELLARIRAHSRAFVMQQQRDEAFTILRNMKISLERKNAELEMLTCRDGLTGILNRRGFNEYLGKEWLRAKRERTPFGMLLLDIDHFKAYNDFYGHQAGDRCLRQVAEALGQGLKRPTDIIARYGGEEFVVLLPDTDEDGGILIAEALRRQVEHLSMCHEASPTAPIVTVSIGVASLQPGNGAVAEELISLADQALYAAKRAGRNCFRSTKDLQVV